MNHVIKVKRLIPSSPEKVFSILTDHEGYTRFGSVTKARLLKQGGSDRNGVGAVLLAFATMT